MCTVHSDSSGTEDGHPCRAARAIAGTGDGDNRHRVRRGGYETQQAALAALIELRRPEAGADLTATVSTGAWLRAWLASRDTLAPLTEHGYHVHIQRYLEPKLGHIPLADLRRTHVQEMLTRLAGRGVAGQPLSANTITRIRATLRAAMNAAIRHGLIEINPATHLDLPRARSTGAVYLHIIPGLGHARLDTLTTRDVRTWLEQLRTTFQCRRGRIDHRRPPGEQRCCAVDTCCRTLPAPRTLQYIRGVLSTALNHARHDGRIPSSVATHVKIALRCGLRRDEILGLRWSDLDTASRTLTVSRALTVSETSPEPARVSRTQPPKNRSAHREIALPDEVLHSLTRHRGHQSAERDRAGGHWTETGLIFTSPTGRPLDPTALLHGRRARCDYAGLRRIGCQQLRYTCAALMLEAGVPLPAIEQFLGYSTNAAPDIATYTLLRLQHQAVEQLGNALRQGTPEHDTTPRSPGPSSTAQGGPDEDEPPAAALTRAR